MGESVILDASWLSARQRAAALAVAEAASADPVQLRCVAPARLTAQRMRRRTDGVSDAYPEVAARMAAAAEPWPEAIVIDTSEDEPITAPAGPGGWRRVGRPGRGARGLARWPGRPLAGSAPARPG